MHRQSENPVLEIFGISSIHLDEPAYSDPARQTVGHGAERPQLVNLCFEARVVGEAGQPTTPEEKLAIGFFAPSDLPVPFVPIHEIRIRDAELGRRETLVR